MSHHLEENSSFASEIRENNYVNAGNAEQFDVVVVGGGPSGSTMAAVTALRGRRTLVLESDLFPRYQIGESLRVIQVIR